MSQATHPGDVFRGILAGESAEGFDQQFPFYPLTAPGMPAPGENFIAEAVAHGDTPPQIEGTAKTRRCTAHGPFLHYLYRRALYDEQFSLNVNVRGQARTAYFVPGHLLGSDTEGMGGGPMRARVMVVGKNPGRDELRDRRNFVGPTSMLLFDALDQLGVGEAERNAWYVTNLVKWVPVDTQSDNIPDAHRKDCAVLLEEELRLVRPDFLLCLGSDASKWILGTNCGVQSMVGRAVDYNLPVHEQGEAPRFHRIRVMAVTHPAQVFRVPELFEEFKNQVGLFISLIGGADIGKREEGLNHRCVYKASELERIVNEIRSDPDPARRLIAVDGEWHGEYPGEPGAYLRTIQFSSKHGEGVTVVLRHQGGAPAFQPAISDAVRLLNKLLKYDPDGNWFPQVGGHFFRADLPWLLHQGIDLRTEYAPAATPELCRIQGGWDTGLAYHAVNEATSYRLTDMQVRLTTAPVYDDVVKDAVTDFCKQKGIKREDLEGYGFIPDWKLHGYAAYDPDVARRIIVRLFEPGGLLDSDWFGNNSWEPFWVAHRASLGFLEMEMTGLPLDKERVDKLSGLCENVYARMLDDFRRNINWADFNPKSAPQAVAFLFGDTYARKISKTSPTGYTTPRPEKALTLSLTPIKSTGKRTRLWADLLARNETHLYSPSTDKEVLGILGHGNKLAMQLRDLRFIATILQGPLRRPVRGADGIPETDEAGNRIYTDGLAAWAHSDGRVRTHLSQCKETGRASSARPPLQAIASRREGDYARIMGTWDTKANKYRGDYAHLFDRPLYEHPIRSIFKAPPGCVLVGADYTGAELAVLAWLSGDPTMIEHVRRNSLPEDHKDHYDIHSQAAVRCFQLSCAPTKHGLKDAGRASLRVAAKNVNFGVPYGRSAMAISRQCREEGVDVTEQDCQRIIDFYFQQYPGAKVFLEACAERTQKERWMAGAYGRYRRFMRTRENSVVGDQKRQGMNFTIQGTVADAVSTAIYNFTEYRHEDPSVDFRLALQMHDALLFVVPVPHLRRFFHDEKDAQGAIVRPSVLRTCMVERVPVWPRAIDNRPLSVPAPYYFGIDSDLYLNWGESLTKAQALALGVDLDLVA